MKFVQLLLLISLAGGVLGCGQKGPLVMPDAQKHKRTIPTAPGAAASPAPLAPAPAPTTPSTPPTADPTHP